jgi:hypothetical protein
MYNFLHELKLQMLLIFFFSKYCVDTELDVDAKLALLLVSISGTYENLERVKINRY